MQELGAELDGSQVSLVVVAGDVDLMHALQLLHRNLGNQQSIVAQLRLAPDTAELAGAKDVSGIGERGSDADGAGLCVHLAIDESDVPLHRVDLAVGECQGERNGGFAFEQVAAGATRALDQGQILGVANGEINFDGVELGDGG